MKAKYINGLGHHPVTSVSRTGGGRQRSAEILGPTALDGSGSLIQDPEGLMASGHQVSRNLPTDELVPGLPRGVRTEPMGLTVSGGCINYEAAVGIQQDNPSGCAEEADAAGRLEPERTVRYIKAGR